MKYFITGISGFIGSNLAQFLLSEGHSVNALVRDNKTVNCWNYPNLWLFTGDLENRQVLAEGMKDCDKVFHLAAFAKPYSKDPAVYEKVNVEGTRNVLETAMKAGIERVVFTSSAATISPSDGQIPSDEASEWKVPFFNAYDRTKRMAEQLAIEYSQNGLHVTIVNPSRVYGPGPLNPSNSVTKMIAGYCTGKWRIVPGNGTRIGNYVFIADVVHGLVAASEKGKAGEKYILGGENLSFDQLFNVLSEITCLKRKMIHLPVSVMISVAKIFEWLQPLTGIPPMITSTWVKRYLNNWCLSSEKAIKEFEYTITPFAAGAKKTIDWLND
jgi:nucleoside-diphosphate-sugar epimerase